MRLSTKYFLSASDHTGMAGDCSGVVWPLLVNSPKTNVSVAMNTFMIIDFHFQREVDFFVLY